jgi:tRNA 2-thiouridine synthesizing protein A
VDCAGLLCVQVLLKLSAQMADAPVGTVFDLFTDDPAAPLDLAAWCHMTGHTFLGEVARRVGDSDVPVYRLVKEARATATTSTHPWRLDS